MDSNGFRKIKVEKVRFKLKYDRIMLDRWKEWKDEWAEEIEIILNIIKL